MTHWTEITDLTAPELKCYAGLTEAQLRSRREPEQGIFIAESEKVIRGALSAGCRPVSLLIDRRHLEKRGAELAALCGDIPLYTADADVLEKLTGFSLTRGFLGAFRRPAPRTMAEVCDGAHRVAVLENVTDASNVGAAFRNAAALGVDAVLLTPSCCDPLGRKAMRVSMGTVLRIPWARTEGTWPADGMQALKTMGFEIASLALDDRSIPIDDPCLKRISRLAVLLGTEGDGLLAGTIRLSDYTVKIPMSKGVDSLNVAAAAAVAFWELCRKDSTR